MLAQAGKACAEKFLRGEIGVGNLMLKPDRQTGWGILSRIRFANSALMRLFRFHGAQEHFMHGVDDGLRFLQTANMPTPFRGGRGCKNRQ